MAEGRRTEINATPDMEANYPDSVGSSPRSRETDSDYFGGSSNQRWEAVDPGGSSTGSSARVRLMCSCGGKILPRPHDNQLAYVGGDTRILAVDRSVKFSNLISKLSNLWGSGVSFKYQLPNEDLDALVSVTNDEDLDNMMAEYDRLQKSGYKNSRLRLFVFPNKSAEGSTSSLGSVLEESKREQWFVEALNNPPVDQGNNDISDGGPISEASAWVNSMPDYLFGLENSGVGTGTNNNGGVEEDRKQALPEVQSSQNSLDADASVSARNNIGRAGTNLGARNDTQIEISPVSDPAEKVSGNLNWGFEDNSNSNFHANSSPIQEIGIPVSPNPGLQRQHQEDYMEELPPNPNLQRQHQQDYMQEPRQHQQDYMQEPPNPNLQRQRQHQQDYMQEPQNPNLQRQRQQQQQDYMQEPPNPNLQRQRQHQQQQDYMQEPSNPTLQRQHQQQQDYMQEPPNLTFQRPHQQQQDYMQEPPNPTLQRQHQQQQAYMQEYSAAADAAIRARQDVNLGDVTNQRAPSQQQQQHPQFPVQEFHNLHIKQQKQDSIPRAGEDININLSGRKMYPDPARAVNLTGQGQEIYMHQLSQPDYYRQDQQQATYWQMHDQGGNSQYPVYVLSTGSNMMQPMTAVRPAPGYYNPVQRVNAAPAVYDTQGTMATVRATAGAVQRQQQAGGVSDLAADPYREHQPQQVVLPAPPVSKVATVYGAPAPFPVAGDVRMGYRATAPVSPVTVGVPHPESYPYTQQHVVYDPNMNAARQMYYTQAVNPQYQPMGVVATDVHAAASLDMTAAAASEQQQGKLATVSQASS